MKVPCGKYRHYKGSIYEVVGMAIHTETLEDIVIYKDKENMLWVRPASMWNEIIDTPNGKTKRFTKLVAVIDEWQTRMEKGLDFDGDWEDKNDQS